MARSRDRFDYFAVVNVPRWLPQEPIRSFRRAYDPTARVIEPHITLVFPVPVSIGLDTVREHVRDIVRHIPPFEIRLKGLEKSWDHYLFLMVAEGRDEVIDLHDTLYTGILRPYLWTERPYVPHLGLGRFVAEEDTHDPLELRPRSLDHPRFERALREARTLNLDYRGRIDMVQVLGLDEAVAHVTRLEELPLG